MQRVELFGTWKGTGQRRPFSGVNDLPPGERDLALHARLGPGDPAGRQVRSRRRSSSFPRATPNTDLAGQVDGSRGQRLPCRSRPTAPCSSARGVTAQKLAAEAPVGTVVAMRLILKPEWAGMVDAIGGGPAIVRNGRPIFRANEGFSPDQLQPRDPRTGVGQLRDGRILQVVVDGRQPGYSAGMTNFELAQAMVRLGAVTASALDSGGSSTLAFDGKLLNRPSDPGGQRAVKECLCVFYYGVYAPPPSAPVLSPNGDGIDETQALAFKVVRPSTVTATIVGPDHVARVTQTDAERPGRLQAELERPHLRGRLRARRALALDRDRHRRPRPQVDRRPHLLAQQHARLPARARARGRRQAPGVVARFQVAHPARVIVRIETRTGVILRRSSAL